MNVIDASSISRFGFQEIDQHWFSIDFPYILATELQETNIATDVTASAKGTKAVSKREGAAAGESGGPWNLAVEAGPMEWCFNVIVV